MNLLYLAWQKPKERYWFPVGRLSFDGVMYRFVYTKGATRSPDFMPFAQMPDLHTCYASMELFPLFKNRILSKSRPEYPSFLTWLDVSPDADDPLTLLAQSGGERATDSLRIIPYRHDPLTGFIACRFLATASVICRIACRSLLVLSPPAMLYCSCLILKIHSTRMPWHCAQPHRL